jgi:hypothetical protein
MTRPEKLAGLNEQTEIAEANAVVKKIFRSMLLEGQWKDEFYLHPLGFYYCRLFSGPSEQIRLHIWQQGYIKKDDLFIHDHYYDLCSWVLCGAIRDFAYSVTPSAVPTEHVLYKSGYGADPNIRTIEATSEYRSVAIKKERLLVAPKKYFISRDTFHSNEIKFDQAELTVTLVYGFNYKEEHRPNIIGWAGGAEEQEDESKPEMQPQAKVEDLIRKAEKIIFG